MAQKIKNLLTSIFSENKYSKEDAALQEEYSL